ncbi:uncharacterized protein E0L32_002691 [Thyridium curvatum]|uniref:DSBA-like thioredoxin domain-containing protein n=1 Tax=Thyridium curvatum TaxID=1093900 RepID=A0A507B789_9PEZI|nr:uncharacterized protein E0L32_002691 [Thyridium curvatum]TPX18182.1 hypothetical protein E0L32_002691 [Thyridium curvatum]
MTQFDIVMTSDKVCPFCYLGKKRLDRAIDAYKRTVPGGGGDTFNVSYRAFYLNPYAPARGVPIREAMAEKFGAARFEPMKARLQAMGKSEGIDFTFECLTGSTRDAHRLDKLTRTKGPGVEEAVAQVVYEEYFEKGGDITSRDMLVAAAAKGGVDPAEARAWLESDAGGEQVDREARDAVREGIHGVPHFEINGEFHIGGAEDVQTFVTEFVRAKEAAEAKSG